jgi:two-component system, LytTR family, sensor kinase
MNKRTQIHYLAQLSGVTLIQLPFTINWLLNQPEKYTYILSTQSLDFLTNILINIIYIHLLGFLLSKKSSLRSLIFTSVLFVIISPSVFHQLSMTLKWILLNSQYSPITFGIFKKITPNYMAGYSLYIAIYFFTHYLLEFKEQKEKTLRATALANEAQLEMLQYQINPHFLFNSLNTIQSLVEIDKERAKEMISDLSDFFRHTLSGKNQVFILLEEEIEALKKYLSIQKERFNERLKLDFDIAPESLKEKIPAFLIHPLVENSIKYGFSVDNNILELIIKTEIEHDTLSIYVKNSGRLAENNKDINKSISSTKTGIENIKKRLALLYPDNHEFTLTEKDNWVIAKIVIGRNHK